MTDWRQGERKKLKRMPVRIPELHSRHATRRCGKGHRLTASDWRRARVAGTLPRRMRVVGDQREMLKDKIAGGCALRVGATSLIERVEIDTASAERHRSTQPRAGEA